MSKQNVKILIEAYECSPVREHAPGASWQIISRLAQWFDVWVLTEQTQYAQEVIDYLNEHPELAQKLHFHFIPRRKKEGFDRKRPPLPIRETLDYRRWQKDAFRVAQHLHQKIQFDVVHHLRSNSFRQPGYLWKLDIPFIWGPMGGTRSVNPGLLSGLDLISKTQYRVRNLINSFQFRYDPHVRNAIQNAKCILTQTSGDQQNLQQVHDRNSIVLHEQATSFQKSWVHTYDGQRELNIAWVGRCIAGKALHFLLEAIAMMNEKNKISLHVIGNGPSLEQWKRQSRKLGVDDQCSWHGWLDPKQANKIMSYCDMLASTSILEGTPATIMNAMSLGVPVMTLKHCGMGDVISHKCGFPIPVNEPMHIAEKMASVLRTILKQSELIEQKSQQIIESGKMYGWDQAAEKIRDVYWRSLGIYDSSRINSMKTLKPTNDKQAVCSS